MAWVKLDTAFPTHPKIVQAGQQAGWLYVCGLCYSSFHLTNGVISRAVLPRLSDVSRPFLHANKLVSAGLWEEFSDGSGWMIHDYAEYQLTSDQVKQQREQAAERVRRHRSNAVTPPLHVAVVTPLEEKRGDEKRKTTTTAPLRSAEFTEFYSIYPLHKAPAAAQKAFTSALKRASAETIIEGAKRYRDDPERKPDFTAHPASWLNAGRWEDETGVAAVIAARPRPITCQRCHAHVSQNCRNPDCEYLEEA